MGLNISLTYKYINVIHHMNRTRREKMYDQDAEKAIDEIQHPVMIKTLSKFKIGEGLLEVELPQIHK